jgi:hypothetical protein
MFSPLLILVLDVTSSDLLVRHHSCMRVSKRGWPVNASFCSHPASCRLEFLSFRRHSVGAWTGDERTATISKATDHEFGVARVGSSRLQVGSAESDWLQTGVAENESKSICAREVNIGCAARLH